MTIHLVPFDQVQLRREPNYLVKGLIPRTGIALVWGPPKSGKTFWLFDLMTHVAGSEDYRGRKVSGGPVIYCCFEGIEGYGARIAAIKQQRQQAGVSFNPSLSLMSERLDLAEQYWELVEAVKGRLGQNKPAAIVLDTLNRSFNGSESNDSDMAGYIRAADAIKNAFACAVIVVHHSGHDAARPRGHSSLTAAIDAQLSVKRSPDDNIVVEVEWMRDGPEGERVLSRLTPVHVGADSEGDAITSCIVVPSDDLPAMATVAPSRLSAALEALDAAAGSDGSVELAIWREELCRRGLINQNSTGYRMQFKRLKDALLHAHRIVEQDGVIRRTQ
jgi:hypothetical protein